MVNSAVRSMDSANDTDPGAVDNRLSLDPGDPRWAKTIAAWADGEDYSVTIGLRQISPGEFEITSFGGRKVAAEPTEEEAPAPPTARRYGNVNPAVMAMDEA